MQTPSERLSAVCSKSGEGDLSKVLKSLGLGLEKNQFVVDLPTLQSLQQLLQWVADLCLFLLASMPSSQGYRALPGSSLLRDLAVVTSLRELLLIIRVWGLINPNCLPHFTTTAADYDVLAQLFKLLSRVWVVLKESSGEFDDSLVDECCLLQSKVVIPPADQGMFGDMSYGKSIFVQPQPIQYSFDEVPPTAGSTSVDGSVLLLEGQLSSQQRKDIIRQINLGVVPTEPVRQCSRCTCVSLLHPLSKSPAMKAWELRFTKMCMCSGHWKLA